MSDTPRTDSASFWDGDELTYSEKVSANECRQLERELNAANERIKQLESDSYKSTQKIQRLEGWNTQNCADKVNLMETIRHRESWIERLIEAGDILARYAENGPYSKFQLNQSDEKKVRIENWESAKKR